MIGIINFILVASLALVCGQEGVTEEIGKQLTLLTCSFV